MACAGLPSAAAELGLGTAAAAAQLKLLAALPPELRERAARIEQRFHLDAPGWYYEGDSPPFLAAVADAVWNQRRIEVRYRRWAAPSDVTRTLEPHGVVLKAGNWYLVARCDGRFRTYRVSQILGLADAGERFERAAGFDLPAHWASSVTDFRSRLQQGEATIRLSPAGRQRTRELITSAVIQAADRTASAGDERGWVTAVVPIESTDHALAEFLRLGADVQILPRPSSGTACSRPCGPSRSSTTLPGAA